MLMLACIAAEKPYSIAGIRMVMGVLTYRSGLDYIRISGIELVDDMLSADVVAIWGCHAFGIRGNMLSGH